MSLKWFETAPRRVLALVAVACAGMIGFGLYLQHVVGLVPCPMCIVQRYAVILVGLAAGLAALSRSRPVWLAGSFLVLLFAGFGAFVGARQTWLQWYPPQFSSCGRDFYGMIEAFPLQRAIPMIFKGSGDCSKVDWTFLGLSLANWNFVFSTAFALVALMLIVRQWGRRQGRQAYA